MDRGGSNYPHGLIAVNRVDSQLVPKMRESRAVAKQDNLRVLPSNVEREFNEK